MSLYLCVLDFSEGYENEIKGIEIGSYDYFSCFRECICKYVENNKWGSKCPIIMNHEEGNGFFSPDDCKKVLNELLVIKRVFENIIPDNSTLQKVKKYKKIQSSMVLRECFTDVDDCDLISQLEMICELSVQKELNVYFQ